MATDLVSSSGSEFVVAMNALQSSSTPPEVIIYVEGWDDVAFWTECVQPYLHKYKFTIGPLRLPDGNIADGKGHLLSNVPSSALGPCLIIAVDADYDWIIDNYRPSATDPSYSSLIRDNEYVLHTYLYSTENYKCHSACLPAIIAKATSMTPASECLAYNSVFSKAIASLFLIHLVSMDLVDGIYPIRKFVDDADKINIDLNTLELKPNSRRYIEQRLSQLDVYQQSHEAEIEAYESKLNALGFDRSKYYLLFKGHCVADTIVKKRFSSLIFKLRLKRIREIKNIPDQRKSDQHLANYCNVTGISHNNSWEEIDRRIVQLINDCSDISKATEGYSRLKMDLDRLFA